MSLKQMEQIIQLQTRQTELQLHARQTELQAGELQKEIQRKIQALQTEAVSASIGYLGADATSAGLSFHESLLLRVEETYLGVPPDGKYGLEFETLDEMPEGTFRRVKKTFRVEGCRVRYTPPEGETIEATIPEIEAKLGPYLRKSEFGDLRRQQTRYDPEVRDSQSLNGVELLLGDIVQDFEPIDPYLQPRHLVDSGKERFWQEVNLEIRRMIGHREFRLIPHALNVYPPGGHFQTHVDTPRHDAARMVGTLVFFLQGQEGLWVDKRYYCGSGHFGNDLHAVFFFGDVPHRVERNSRPENRISLTYDVVLTKSLPLSRPLTDDLARMLLRKSDRQILFCLRDAYTLDAIQQEILKSAADQELLEMLRSTGQPVQVVRLTVVSHQYRVRVNELPDREIDFNEPLYRVRKEYGQEKVSSYLTFTEHGENSIDSVFVLEPRLEGKVMIVDPYRTVEDIVSLETRSEEESFWTGNQHDPGIAMVCNRVYHTAAILFDNR